MKLDALIGRRVDHVLLAEDEYSLCLVCGDDQFHLDVEGDCCSEAWWADILGVQALLGEVITEVRDNHCIDTLTDDRTRQEEDAVYSVTLTTVKGHCDLIFRNSSNGYYGGWYTVRHTPPFTEGRVWYYHIPADTWFTVGGKRYQSITEDYSG